MERVVELTPSRKGPFESLQGLFGGICSPRKEDEALRNNQSRKKIDSRVSGGPIANLTQMLSELSPNRRGREALSIPANTATQSSVATHRSLGTISTTVENTSHAIKRTGHHRDPSQAMVLSHSGDSKTQLYRSVETIFCSILILVVTLKILDKLGMHATPSFDRYIQPGIGHDHNLISFGF